MKEYFFAVDLGATSGRTIVAQLCDSKLQLEELTRFPNNLIEQGGHFYWDIHALYAEVLRGLKTAADRRLPITSIGIDTWGVDFVCVADDGAILRNPRAYRDPITFEAMDDYLDKVMSRRQLYDATGTQIIYFNTLFQLHAMRLEGNSALQHARRLLFLPDALGWMLTGEAVCEYTIASTAQLLNPSTRDFDERLLASVGLERCHFGRMVNPGSVMGLLTPEIQHLTGLGALPVVAVAGHDTASAVAAVPARNGRFAYLSSGTWSLMGIELPQPLVNDWSYERNFTNEGGVEGKIRLLKNICGMWLYERCRKEWPEEVRHMSHAELQGSAMTVQPFRSIIHPDDPVFANPPSMIGAIQQYCRTTGQAVPDTPAEFCRCIFDSLALRYRQVFSWLREASVDPIDTLHIIGGGSLNGYLNQFTANSCNVEVLAGPQEGTALGNVMMQAKALGLVSDIWEMRHIIANSVELKRFSPQDPSAYDEAFQRFLQLSNGN